MFHYKILSSRMPAIINDCFSKRWLVRYESTSYFRTVGEWDKVLVIKFEFTEEISKCFVPRASLQWSAYRTLYKKLSFESLISLPRVWWKQSKVLKDLMRKRLIWITNRDWIRNSGRQLDAFAYLPRIWFYQRGICNHSTFSAQHFQLNFTAENNELMNKCKSQSFVSTTGLQNLLRAKKKPGHPSESFRKNIISKNVLKKINEILQGCVSSCAQPKIPFSIHSDFSPPQHSSLALLQRQQQRAQ